jgi:CRP-like cAMP-binding protein
VPHPQSSLIEPVVARLCRHTHFEPAELEAIRALPGRVVQLPARRDFVHLGEETHEASFVVEGLIARFDQTRKGDRQVVAVYLEGDIPDLHSVVIPHASSALHAFTVCTLIRIPHVALKLAAAKHPGIAQALWRESALDVAKVSKWVLSVGRKDSMARMAHLICEVACRSTGSATPGAVDFGFPVTQADLGDMLGLSPVHINRTIKTLRLANLVTVDRGRVQILDWEKLSRIGDFDARYLSLALTPALAMAVPMMPA